MEDPDEKVVIINILYLVSCVKKSILPQMTTLLLLFLTSWQSANAFLEGGSKSMPFHRTPRLVPKKVVCLEARRTFRDMDQPQPVQQSNRRYDKYGFDATEARERFDGGERRTRTPFDLKKESGPGLDIVRVIYRILNICVFSLWALPGFFIPIQETLGRGFIPAVTVFVLVLQGLDR